MNIQVRPHSSYPRDLSLKAADLLSKILFLEEGGKVYLEFCDQSAIAELVSHRLISVEVN